MRLATLLVLFSLAGSACAAPGPAAPTGPAASAVAGPPAAADSIEAVFARFVEAVRAGDPDRVADFMRFPIRGTAIADRRAFQTEFYPYYLGGHADSFGPIVAGATADELVPSEDGRYYYMALDEGDCANEPECSGAAMIFYFAPEGESWIIEEIQFAG